jgi:hypothetical protein
MNEVTNGVCSADDVAAAADAVVTAMEIIAESKLYELAGISICELLEDGRRA